MRSDEISGAIWAQDGGRDRIRGKDPEGLRLPSPRNLQATRRTSLFPALLFVLLIPSLHSSPTTSYYFTLAQLNSNPCNYVDERSVASRVTLGTAFASSPNSNSNRDRRVRSHSPSTHNPPPHLHGFPGRHHIPLEDSLAPRPCHQAQSDHLSNSLESCRRCLQSVLPVRAHQDARVEAKDCQEDFFNACDI